MDVYDIVITTHFSDHDIVFVTLQMKNNENIFHS